MKIDVILKKFVYIFHAPNPDIFLKNIIVSNIPKTPPDLSCLTHTDTPWSPASWNWPLKELGLTVFSRR
jgi:hypothetical protein